MRKNLLQESLQKYAARKIYKKTEAHRSTLTKTQLNNTWTYGCGKLDACSPRQDLILRYMREGQAHQTSAES